jgi:hypothetical protein
MRRLNESGIYNYVANKRERLSQTQQETRLGYALEYFPRPPEFWDEVHFLDEKVWSTENDGHVLVWRPRNTRYQEEYVYESRHHG